MKKFIPLVVFFCLLVGYYYTSDMAKENGLTFKEQLELIVYTDDKTVSDAAKQMKQINDDYVVSLNRFANEIAKRDKANLYVIINEGDKLDDMLDTNAQKMRDFKIPKVVTKEHREKLESIKNLYSASIQSMKEASDLGTQMANSRYNNPAFISKFILNINAANMIANEANDYANSLIK